MNSNYGINELRTADELNEKFTAPLLTWLSSNGYEIFWHPIKMTPMFTHRYVLEELPNFNILPGHVVHHRDKNKLNNRLANLDVMTKDAHDDIHLKGAPNRLFRKKQT